MSQTFEEPQAPVSPEELKWYEKEPPPNHARIKLHLDDLDAVKKGTARPPITLCDVPIDGIVSVGYAHTEGNITITVDNFNIYNFVVSHYLRDKIPPDSPFLLQVPGAKFMLPPKSGQVRLYASVPIKIATDKTAGEDLYLMDNVPFADIDEADLRVKFEKRPPDFDMAGAAVTTLKNIPPRLRISENNETALNLDNIAKLGIPVDPHAVGARKMLDMLGKTPPPTAPMVK